MRKLIISIATAASLISIAAATSTATLLGETSVVAPTVTDHRRPAVPASGTGHSLHHAHMPLLWS